MENLSFVLTALLITVVGISAKKKAEEDVLTLTENNFDKSLHKFEHLFVEFYDSSCAHCKAFELEYAKAARTLKETKKDAIHFAKIDATVETNVAKKYDVASYPTIKFFDHGKPYDYTGEPTSDDIIRWLSAQTGSTSTRSLKDITGTKAFIDKHGKVVIGFFKDENSASAKEFLEVAAATIDGVSFGITDSQDVSAAYNLTTDEAVLMFNKVDDERYDLTENINRKSIREFIEVNQMSSLIIEFSQANAQKIFGDSIKTHVVLFIRKTSIEFPAKISIFKRTAFKFNKEKLLFIYVDIDVVENVRLMEHFSIHLKDCPTYVYVTMDDKGILKYKPDSPDVVAENMIEFITEVLENKRQSYLNSEEIPDDWDAKPVKVLVGKNFDKVVRDKTKNVLVEFCASFSEDCKKFDPIWEELGEHFKSRTDTIIAKLDAIMNELPDMKLQQFPTIKFYPKNSEKVIDYTGEKTFEDLKIFLQNKIGEVGTAPQKDEEMLQEKKESAKSNRIEL